eukprot:TRINITY_DN1782_c0_g1_i2.p1 TRINITY_DN1782_c0_g1~~TRINITY_DN1782_c0_g1_i2.p1  ORF type:complete len:307 (-),score=85.99 TRINITY_DN1782_c0_g1_i2:353-1273(-)
MMVPTADFQGWTPTPVTGALLFCVDRERQVKSLRLYNLNNWTMGMQQDISPAFKYTELAPYFHAIEDGEVYIGFEMQDEHLAQQFYKKVMQGLHPDEETKSTPAEMPTLTKKKTGGGLFGFFGSPKEPVKEVSYEISRPTGVQHIQHIGYDPKKGEWDVNNIPPEWKAIFKNAGISKRDLLDKDTAAGLMMTIKSFQPVAPPAPPAPPVPAAPAAPSAPPVTRPASSSMTGGGAVSQDNLDSTESLSDQIKKGVQLKAVVVPDVKNMEEVDQRNLEALLKDKMKGIRGQLSVAARDDETSELDDDW